jgi:hypothetical protein
MADESPAEQTIEVDLRNPSLAALLAWLIPGAGHLYQRRYGKGVLFMVCILSTWFFGLWLGAGHSVYASNRTIARQLMFGCQLAVGLPATPAIVQAMSVRGNRPLPFGEFMAPPNENGGMDELSDWNLQLGAAYDMGVLYTMIAGLLNVLAIYDAYGGPLLPSASDEKKREAPGKSAAASGPEPTS